MKIVCESNPDVFIDSVLVDQLLETKQIKMSNIQMMLETFVQYGGTSNLLTIRLDTFPHGPKQLSFYTESKGKPWYYSIRCRD